MRLALILVLAATIPAQAQSVDFAGTYDAGDCAAELSETRLLIEGDRAEFWESQCRLANPVNVRDMEAMLYDLQCAGEGEEWNERLFLSRGHDGGLVAVRRGFATTYARCD